jgi:protein TonB
MLVSAMPYAGDLDSNWQSRSYWVGAAVLLHGAALAWVAGTAQPTPIEPPQVLSVALLAPAPEPAAKPLPPPPKPQPVVKQQAPAPRPTKSEPAPAPTPASITTAAPPPPAPAAAAPAPAAPAPVVEARFDADYLQNPRPIYPPAARRLGEQGKVWLRAHVLPNGNTDNVELKQTSGSPRLDSAALEAVKRWRFVPARQGGEAVSSWVVIPISFSLES